MNRQEISAFLANCKASDMLVYRDEGESGTVVVADDGKKYRYSVHDLEVAESNAEAAAALEKNLKAELSDGDVAKMLFADREKPKPSKPKPKPRTKPKAATRKKPAEKKSTKSATKPTTEPPTKPDTKPTNNSGTKLS